MLIKVGRHRKMFRNGVGFKAGLDRCLNEVFCVFPGTVGTKFSMGMTVPCFSVNPVKIVV